MFISQEFFLGMAYDCGLDVIVDGQVHAQASEYADRLLDVICVMRRSYAAGLFMVADGDPAEPFSGSKSVPVFAVVLEGDLRGFVHQSRVWRQGPFSAIEAMECTVQQLFDAVNVERRAAEVAVNWALTAFFLAKRGPTDGIVPFEWTLRWKVQPQECSVFELADGTVVAISPKAMAERRPLCITSTDGSLLVSRR